MDTKIAQLNDQFRRGLLLNGFKATPFVSALPHPELMELCKRIMTFDDFTEGNDPCKEHDFGAVEFAGEEYFWKIDYYDRANPDYGSDDPANPAKTKRVLTVMHSSEY